MLNKFNRLVGLAMAKKDYDFDEVINRHNTASEKWDFLKERFGYEDLLPLWVADMDFRSPKPVIDAIISRAMHGVYGYTCLTESYYESVIRWYKRRYKWEIRKEWIVYTPGVVPAINLAIRAFTNPGDKIIVQPPVYYPFYNSIESNGRRVLYNPLKLTNNRYEMDFDDLEIKAKDSNARIMILCSPHNPVGRVWTKDELSILGDICIDNGVLVISDEIHSDITYPGIVHTNFASISDKFANNSITCTSVSKTFNLAGLQISNIIIPNKDIRQIFEVSTISTGISNPNAFAEIAARTAYNECEDWLDEFLKYIKGNFDFLKEFIKEKLPKVKIIEPEGTYLCWLDFREVESDAKTLERLILKDAKVALDEGYIFRNGGEGFERINMACPRSILKEALNRIASTLADLETKIPS